MERYCLGFSFAGTELEGNVAAIRSSLADLPLPKGATLGLEPCAIVIPSESFAPLSLNIMGGHLAKVTSTFDLMCAGISARENGRVVALTCGDGSDKTQNVRNALARLTGVPAAGLEIPYIPLARVSSEAQLEDFWSALQKREHAFGRFHLPVRDITVFRLMRGSSEWTASSGHTLRKQAA